MASSSQKVSGNLSGMELVPYVPNAKTKNDDLALCLAIEQPTVMISLMKNSRRHARSRAPQVPNEISFKLPQKCYANLFVSAEKIEGEAGLRNILWSAPVDFRLPENNMNQILKRDEDVRSTYGVGPLPLAERLAGWKVEKRQRPRLERYDKFFYHKAGGQFRTFPEVVRFINHASLPKRAPQRIKAQYQGVLALEAPGSEPSQAASLKRTRPLPISIGSTSNRLKYYGTKNKGLRSWANDWKDHCKLPNSTSGIRSAFLVGNRSPQACFTLQMVAECLERDKRRRAIPISIGSTERLNYGTKNKGLRSSANGFSVGNKSSQACFTLQMVVEFLERDRKRRADKNLRHCDRQKEKETSSSEVMTPRMTPERGRECLRRFNNEECNMPQGNQANMMNEEGDISIIILSDDSEQEIEGETIIPDLFIPDEDLVGLEDFE